MSEALPVEAASPKVDPETLVLRGRPARVIRFRRGAVIAIAALGSTAIVGVTWVALKPAAFRIVAGADDQKDVASRAPDDALAGAPKSYGDVPRLGPPLPGDLGRPILRRQEALGEWPPAGSSDQRAQAAEAERQRLAAERKAARESGVMMQLGASDRATATPPDTGLPSTSAGQEAQPVKLALNAAQDPGNQHRKVDFLAGNDESGDVNPHTLIAPISPYMLSAGSVIAASLITGLNSDLPGLVTAQVTENAYDTATGRTLLIPQGARLIGSYDSVIAYGQSRALVVWQRIVFPDGSSIRIDNVPATDLAGYAGLADKVDAHTWQLLKGVGLATLLGVGTELSLGDSESDLVRAIRGSAQQGTSRAGDQIVMKNLNVQPTIKVRPGWPLRVVVHKDIVLAPWPGQEQ
ncbi:TrbI/VirB10 family protein [Sphingomonas qomolangmaensis]|uniref:TrbI/VirB10 family protein n=1 Tax=Sphingomonas qomolangmaensis TaxID=2918765 RepID=A0ABY5LAE3_9SPHN|nr:TrbI/VirB10 family protein [Sphingomonas qomolangmaensis]UUL82593.1 TrbI/VirB10 family protein [Sphingomonas qomolangmaensis]